MIEHHVAWWNVENLFNVENSSHRSSKLQKTLSNELTGWNVSVLDKKLKQLSKIISKMNNNSGPDILGVCEIEDEDVLNKLATHSDMPNRNYGIAHSNSSDKRGIDVAFIYDKDKYNFSGQVFDHVIIKRNATREIVQVNLTSIQTSRQIILVGNHWPSRRGGSAIQSEPYRILAGENLAYFVQSIVEHTNDETPIIVCGDFNDEPFNRSITEYARATRNEDRVKSATSQRLLNLMWPEMGIGKASYYYNKFPNMLDQFMVSKSIVKGIKFNVKPNSVKVLDFPEMKDDDGFPIKHGRPSSEYNDQGFSDHFPVEMILIEDIPD